jgi:hypothetical protein
LFFQINGQDRHWAGSGPLEIDSDVAEEYWRERRGGGTKVIRAGGGHIRFEAGDIHESIGGQDG